MVRHERINKRKLFGPVLQRALKFCLLLFFISHSAQAATLAQKKVLELSAQVRQHLSAGHKEMANRLFLEQFDMTRFGKRCLIDHWDTFSPTEQQRFTELLFQNLLKAANEKNFFVHDAKKFLLTPQQEITVNKITEIKSKLETSEKTLSLKLFLVSASGSYQIIDYEVEGALLSRNYRSHFNFLMKKYGKAGFFERLEKKLTEAS